MNNFNAVNDEILKGIERLRAKGLSYSQIGIKINLHKAAVFMLIKGKWYPKIPEIKQRILLKIRELDL